MNLIIDIGNTLIKMSLFKGNDCLELSKPEKDDVSSLISGIKKMKNNFPDTERVILSSVSFVSEVLISFLKENFTTFINFNYKTKIPVRNNYNTPETLGKDRIAAVVAAYNIFKGYNVLIFDAGTALTVDFISNTGEYYGGSISPGIMMRYKALNNYTENLPLVEVDEDFSEIYGTSTKNAIKAGVQNGIINEVEAYIKIYKEKYKDLKVIFTGGDTFFFEKRLKSEIFADPNLVMKGLNIILNYNE